MIFVIYENPANVINSAYTDFYDKYPKSCIYRLGGRASQQEFGMLQQAPLLMPGWLIICGPKIAVKSLQMLENGSADNVILVQCSSKGELEDIIDRFDSIDYKVIDNYFIGSDVMIDWIQKQSKCDYDTAKHLYWRLGGNIRDIVSSVSMLSFMPVMSKYVVNQYTSKSLKAGVNDVVPFMLGIQRRGVNVEDIIKVVYRFRFGFSWLIQELRKQAEEYFKIFSAVCCGDLTINDYVEYRDTARSKRIRAMPYGKLKHVVLAFGDVSMEHVYYVRTQLGLINTDRFSIIKLIYLIRTGG